ncbi:hypothetical protein RYX36_012983 [Vicia faba]
MAIAIEKRMRRGTNSKWKQREKVAGKHQESSRARNSAIWRNAGRFGTFQSSPLSSNC